MNAADALDTIASAPTFAERHGRYDLRFVRTRQDVLPALELRFEVFNRELGEGLAASHRTGRDEDAFDAQCDHLLVTDRASGRVVGTYRMQVHEAAARGRGFYSAVEFELDGLGPLVLHDAVELGRACIAREHRNRTVLGLLWRGIVAYARWHRRRYLFGCSSLSSRDPADGRRLHAWLRERGLVHPDAGATPRPAYALPAADASVERDDGRAPAPPPLFAAYLRHGAVVCGPPAIDREFGTIDFLTLLDLEAVPPSTLARLSRSPSEPSRG